MAKSLVSVIVTQRGTKNDLLASQDSLRSQTFRDFELIIPEPRESTAAVRNQGLRESNCDLVAFLDAGDVWSSSKLEKQILQFQVDPASCWCYCQSQKTTCNHSGNILRHLLINNFVPSSSVVARRSVFQRSGYFNESAAYRLSEDWDMWLRIAAEYPVKCIEEPLTLAATPTCLEFEQLCRSRRLVVESAVARHGQALIDLRSKALAEIYISAGKSYLEVDNRAEARGHFAEALTHNPLLSGAYVNWIASFLPCEAQQQIRDLQSLARHIGVTRQPIGHGQATLRR